MEDYKRLGNYQEKMKEIKIEEKEEVLEFKKFTTNLNTIFAIGGTIRDTKNRYLTALKMQDEKTAEKQKKHTEMLISQIEKTTHILKDTYPQVEESLARGFEKAKKDPKFKQIKDKAEQFRAKGLAKDDRESLAQKGLTKEQIEYVDKSARKQTYDELPQKSAEGIRLVYDTAMETYDESIKEVREIERIDSLMLNDKLRLLLKEGLITADEFNERRDHLEHEVSYPIWEIWPIGLEHISKLKEKGINTTVDLLEKSKKKSERVKLARELNVDGKLVDQWVFIADVMRIKGIGMEYYILLADFGIKSVDDLTKSKPDILYKQLIKHIEKTNWGGKPPTEELVTEWIKNAKETEKVISDI
jgi:hypothetical protein